ncbi:MFS transporter [Methanosarcina sp. 2.H.T.1A.6]|uniref:MFS transporter n=1 Tax=Methanosarcina sp. 2.H.T.1A.6 TaxID=1483599 RepID=UPI00064E9452
MKYSQEGITITATVSKKLAGAITGHFLIDLYTPILPIILPLLIDTMGLSYFLAGLIVTAFNVVSSVTQPFVGLYSDKTGWRASVPLCVSIGSLGICLTVFTNNYLLLLMMVMGAAIGHALFHPSAMDLVYRLSPPAKRGMYNSIFTTSGSISYSIGPFIAGVLIEFAGLSSVVWMVIPGIIGAAWIYRNDLRYLDEKVFEKPAKTVISHPLERKKFWWIPAGLVVIICSLRAWAYVGLITYLPTLLTLESQDFDTVTTSLIVTIMLFFGVGGQIAGGYFSDRFGRKLMLVLGLLFAVPLFALIFLADGWLMYFGIMMYSFFACFCYVTSVTMTQELLPGNVAFASGLILGLCMGVGGVGVAVIGLAADVMGSLFDAMFLLIIPTTLCPILAMFVRYPVGN